MFIGLILFSLICALISATSATALNITPCKISDSACILSNSQALYATISQGSPELGIESIDPMHHDEIEGKLSILSYNLKNSTIIGFKNCIMSDTILSLEKLNFKFTMNCPEISMTGIYDIDGRIIVLPIQGNGDFKLDTKNTRLQLDAELKLNPGENGKTYMTFKNVDYTTDIGGLDFDIKNLFNGQKVLADPVLKFMRENWKEVGAELQGPVVGANIKKVVKTFNKLLKTIPLENLIAA